jgi:LytS/YehU family sensor histidine kinase
MHAVSRYKLDHIAFWCCTVVFYGILKQDLLQRSGVVIFVLDLFTHSLLLAMVCYINIYLLFAKFFRKDRFIVYALSALLLLFLYAMIQNALDTWIFQLSASSQISRSFYHNTYYNFSVGLFYVAFSLSLILSKRWYSQQLLLQQVQTEKLKAELQYLKAQLDPHFLFNSINTIYFQIDPSNTEARESLEKFSAMLRYQLYECNEEDIPIEQELHYLRSYVDLQRLRKNKKHAIVFNTDTQVENFRIAPLLLLPFVENAFKHLSNYPDRLNRVELDLRRNNGSFIFNICNTVSPSGDKTHASGIGLNNARRRLELLYENRYRLNIKSNSNQYSVELELQLS